MSLLIRLHCTVMYTTLIELIVEVLIHFRPEWRLMVIPADEPALVQPLTELLLSC